MLPDESGSFGSDRGLLDHMLESVAGAHFAVDRDWRFLHVNRYAEDLLSLTHEQLMGQNLWELFPAALGTAFEANLRHVATTGDPAEHVVWFEPHRRSYEVRAYPIPEGLMVLLRDASLVHAARLEREELVEAQMVARAKAERLRLQLAIIEGRDPLTGLANRDGFDRRLAALLEEPGCWPITVLYIDLDRFKVINDSLGHHAGDDLLVEAAERLRRTVRTVDLLGRHDGDTFTVACPGTDLDQTRRVCEQLLAAFRRPFTIDDRTMSVTASIGVRVAAVDADATTLLRDANAAMHEAKADGPSHFAVFSDDTRTAVLHRFQVEAELGAAMRGGEIELFWQPAFELGTGRIFGVEGLARWHHPTRGLLHPAAFIPIAEETDLILELGRHTLLAGAHQAVAWREQTGIPSRDFGSVWVNVSAREFIAPTFPDSVAAILEQVGVEHGGLGLEVTETALFADTLTAADNLTRLREMGVRIALDDFGTGYSSLAYLLHFPIDIIKIDRSFTAEVHHPDLPHHAIVSAIVAATHALGGKVLAEGVEHPRQLQVLADIGCDAASGYLLARPAPASEVIPMLPDGGEPGRLAT